MIIQFYLLAIIIVLLYLFSGIGLTILVCPKNVVKYSLFFAPFIGLIYFGFFCWILVNYSPWGTDVYANFLLIPPAICLIIVCLFKRSAIIEAFWPLKPENIAIYVICLVNFFIISLPYAVTLSSLNAVTLLNSDIGNYASASAFLTQGTVNNVFGADPWILGLIPDVFSAFVALAVPSSIVHAETYTVFNTVEYLFFVFSLPFIFIIAKDIFKWNDGLAFIVTGVAGINYNVILIVYFGYLSQIIGMGYFLSVTFLVLFFIQRREKITTLINYVPLFALLLSGLLVSYPTYFPLFFIPLACYLACEFIWIKRLGNVLDLGFFFIITGLCSVSLFPTLSIRAFNKFLYYSNVVAGFNANPLLPSWMLGLFTEKVDLDQLLWAQMPLLSIADIILSVIVGVVVWLSFRYLYDHDKDLFTISLCFGIFFVLLYTYLIFKETTSPDFTGEGYKAYKLVTYFIQFFIIIIFSYFNKFNFREPFDAEKSAAFIILILLICVTIFSTVQLISVDFQRSTSVKSSIIELKNVGGMPNIHSVNIDDPDVITHMWMYYFIFLNKKTYSSYHNELLQGEWTIRRGTDADVKKLFHNSTTESVVRVNADFYLVKAYNLDCKNSNLNIFSPLCGK